MAAAERQAEQVAEALRPVGQLSQLLGQLMQEAVAGFTVEPRDEPAVAASADDVAHAGEWYAS